MRWIAFAAIGAAFFTAGHAPVLAQDAPPVPGFSEAVALCRDAMVARVPLAELPRASEVLVLAGPEVRAAHPMGSAPSLWVLAGRNDANITLVEPEPKSCSVFAVDANVVEVFDAAALSLTENAAFSEGEPTNRRSGGVQRNFRTADGNARVELQTFGEGDDILAMALFGRRR